MGFPAAFKPKAASVPSLTLPVEEEDTAGVLLIAGQDGTVEENPGCMPARLLPPTLRNEALVLPERLENLGIKENVASAFKPLDFRLAMDPALARLERVH